MGQFSAEKPVPPGSTLSGNQHLGALALAELYQSTGRPAEARAVLAPALKGFSPTPQMPEIAEALALMDRLA